MVPDSLKSIYGIVPPVVIGAIETTQHKLEKTGDPESEVSERSLLAEFSKIVELEENLEKSDPDDEVDDVSGSNHPAVDYLAMIGEGSVCGSLDMGGVDADITGDVWSADVVSTDHPVDDERDDAAQSPHEEGTSALHVDAESPRPRRHDPLRTMTSTLPTSVVFGGAMALTVVICLLSQLHPVIAMALLIWSAAGIYYVWSRHKQVLTLGFLFLSKGTIDATDIADVALIDPNDEVIVLPETDNPGKDLVGLTKDEYDNLYELLDQLADEVVADTGVGQPTPKIPASPHQRSAPNNKRKSSHRGERRVKGNQEYQHDLLIPQQGPDRKQACAILNTARGPRPHVECDMYGVYKCTFLADTGAAVTVLDVFTFNKVRDILARKGHHIPEIKTETSLRAFQGAKISAHCVILMHLYIGEGEGANIVYNIPTVIVQPESTQDIAILGMNLFSTCGIEFKWRGAKLEEELYLHFSKEPHFRDVKCELLMKTPHAVHSIEEKTIGPLQVAVVDLDLDACPQVASNLDEQDLYLTHHDEDEGELPYEIEQIVQRSAPTGCPGRLRIQAVIRNTQRTPLVILDNQPIGVVSSLDDDACSSLEPIADYINAIDAKVGLVKFCLCEGSLSENWLMIPLNKCRLSSLGIKYELISPCDRAKIKDETYNIVLRNPHIYLLSAGVKGVSPLTPEDMVLITSQIPKTYGIWVPYARPADIDEHVIRAIHTLTQAGYSVRMVAYVPQIRAMPYSTKGEQLPDPTSTDKQGNDKDFNCPLECEACARASIEASMPLIESYKIVSIIILLPSASGTVPARLDNMVEGTRQFTLKVWDMHVTYHYIDRNTLVFLPHIPLPIMKMEERLVTYFEVMLSYMKPSFPMAKIKVCCSSAVVATEEIWPALNEAIKGSARFPDHFVAELKPNRIRDVTKSTYVAAHRLVYMCDCVTCSAGDKGTVTTEPLVLHESNWPLEDLTNGSGDAAPVTPVKDLMRKLLKVQRPSELSPRCQIEAAKTYTLGDPDNVSEDPQEVIHCTTPPDSVVGLSSLDTVTTREHVVVKQIGWGVDGVPVVSLIAATKITKEARTDDDPQTPSQNHISTHDANTTISGVDAPSNPATHYDKNTPAHEDDSSEFSNGIIPGDILEWYSDDPAETPYVGTTPFERADIPQLVDLSHLTPAQQEVVIDVIFEYRELFSTGPYDHRMVEGQTVDFEVKDPDISFYEKPFPMSARALQTLKEHLELMCRKGFLIPSTARKDPTVCYSRAFCVARNSDAKLNDTGEMRVVYDLTRLNKELVDDKWGEAVPGVSTYFEALSGAEYVTIADISQCFQHFRLSRRSRRFLGVSTAFGRFTATCGVLGLSCMPGHIWSKFSQMYSAFLLLFVSIFMDDTKIVSYRADSGKPQFPLNSRYKPLEGTQEGLTKGFLVHMSLIREFFKQSNKFGLLFKLSKLNIATQKDVRYLGWIVNVKENSLTMLPSRIPFFDKVDPDNITGARLATVLGTAAFVSSCIDSYASKASLLYNRATQPKAQGCNLTEVEKGCLREICSNVANASKRYLFNPALPVEIHTDASVASCASVLTMILGQRRVLLSYMSWKFTPAESRRWTSAMKELSPIIRTIKIHFNLLVQCSDLTIFTDCMSLVWAIKNSRLSSGNTIYDRYLAILLALPLKFKVIHMDAVEPILAAVDQFSRDPRYFMRHSNRLRRKKKEEVVPYHWRPSMIITTDQLMDELRKTDAWKWPKTDTKHVLAEDADDDPLSDLKGFEKTVIAGLLPRIELNTATYKQAKDAPPAEDAPSMKSIDSTRTSGSGGGRDSVLDEDPDGQDDTEDIPRADLAQVSGSGSDSDDNEDINDEAYISAVIQGQLKPVDNDFLPSDHLVGIMRQQFDLAAASTKQLTTSDEELRHLRAEIFQAKGQGLTMKQIIAAQRKCPHFGPIISTFLEGKATATQKKKYSLQASLVLTKNAKDGPKIILPLRAAVHMVAVAHLILHSGIDGIYDLLKTYYHAFHFRDVVAAVVSSCQACRMTRWSTRKPPEGSVFRSTRPFQALAMDFMVQRPCHYLNKTYHNILNICCIYSKYCILVPTVTEKANEVSRILDLLLPLLPPVEILQSDGGPGLLASRAVRDTVAKYNIETKIGLANNPTSHSIVENLNGQARIALVANLRMMKSKNWCESLPFATFALNSMKREFRILERRNGKDVAKVLKTSAMHIALGYDPLQNINQILGPTTRDNPRRRENLDRIHQALTRQYKQDAEEQHKRDQKADKTAELQPGSFCLIKRIPRDKHKARYLNNLFLIKERYNRQVLVQSVFGNLTIFPIYIGFAKHFKNSTLLKLLPLKLRKLYGGYVSTNTKARKLPFELRSTLSEPPPVRITRSKSNPNKTIRIPQQAWAGMSDSSSDDDEYDSSESSHSSNDSDDVSDHSRRSDDSKPPDSEPTDTRDADSQENSIHNSPNQPTPVDKSVRRRTPAPQPAAVQTRATRRAERLNRISQPTMAPENVPPFGFLPFIEGTNLVTSPHDNVSPPQAQSTPHDNDEDYDEVVPPARQRRANASKPLTIVPRQHMNIIRSDRVNTHQINPKQSEVPSKVVRDPSIREKIRALLNAKRKTQEQPMRNTRVIARHFRRLHKNADFPRIDKSIINKQNKMPDTPTGTTQQPRPRKVKFDLPILRDDGRSYDDPTRAKKDPKLPTRVSIRANKGVPPQKYSPSKY